MTVPKTGSQKLTHVQMAILESLLLMTELLNNLSAEIEGGLPLLLDEEVSEAIGEEFATLVTEPLDRVATNTRLVLEKFTRFFEIPITKLRDQDCETLLARKDAEYCADDGIGGMAANYSMADIGVLAWKLGDRLGFLNDETYEKTPGEPTYVVELKLE